jgi:Cu(I)/Ag(I) efflux system membrane fusion protein
MFSSRILSILFAVVALVVLDGCSKSKTAAKDPNVDYYTCTMHPSVRAQKPDDKCPICGMDLVPVMKKGGPLKAGESEKAGGMKDMPGMKAGSPAGESSEFVVPIERQQQVGVTYATVERRPLHHTIRAVGFIVPDRGRRWEFVSRVEGYVQKLHVTSPGQLVAKDQPLLSIYSPDLFASEHEYVELLRARDKNPGMRESNDRLIQSARRRLELWNITPEQITQLEKSREPSDTINLLSPFRGVVEKVAADQGKKVMVGESLVSVADLSTVWLWAEFYENELTMVHEGQTLDITATSYPGKKFKGTISLINPFIEEMKRTAKVRVDIANEDFLLRPGMYVNAELEMDMGEGLVIPLSAIMPTGLRSYVFVDKKEGKLEPRLVQLGQKYGEFYEVQSGLAEGERVVNSANFLIDAESKVQGALKGFEEPTTGEPSSDRPAPAPTEVK